MARLKTSFGPDLDRHVKGEALEPHQQKTAPNFKTATDFYEQVMLKHPHLSEFHSRAEFLHACLLEGDPEVRRYVPQPFSLRIGADRYTPDCYVVREKQPRQVVELKPHGEMAEDMRIPLTHFFARQGMRFEVVSNESVYAHEQEALNWREIVQILHQAQELDTTDAEEVVLDKLSQRGEFTLGDFIDPGDRERTYPYEIALFRLLHQGHVKAEMTSVLDFDTSVSLCG